MILCFNRNKNYPFLQIEIRTFYYTENDVRIASAHKVEVNTPNRGPVYLDFMGMFVIS